MRPPARELAATKPSSLAVTTSNGEREMVSSAVAAAAGAPAGDAPVWAKAVAATREELRLTR
jgi:hypothetical protein